MPYYIVERKGIFGTLYVGGANYSRYQNVVKNKENAYKFADYKNAEKAARQLFGTVLTIEDEETQSDQKSIIQEPSTQITCKDCKYFESEERMWCKLFGISMTPDDYCSKAQGHDALDLTSA